MNKSMIIVGALAGASAVAIYYNKELLWEVVECAMYDQQKIHALHKLRKIRVVLTTFVKELENAEKMSKTDAAGDGTLDVQAKKLICGLSVDLDYIFDSLDAIQGDQCVKAERKKLVDDFKEYAKRVDRLTALMR